MTEEIINDVLQQMLPCLDNAQAKKLQDVMEHTLQGYSVSRKPEEAVCSEDNELVYKFVEAKRIEGCSEKTLAYYKKTIEATLSFINKEVTHIMTEDLRDYLTDYQTRRHPSHVTVDNVRRILSSFFFMA